MDNISHNTLRDCVQRIFEDGPKRDHPLWIGNLRIQALTAYTLFAEEELVRRCFYLLAVSVRNEDGFISSFIYKSNCYYSGETHLIDYALLFVVTDCDYYENTGDLATVKDLLELCKEQINSVCSLLDRNRTISPRSYWWTFIDWMPGLEKNTATQGVYLYTLDWFSNLLRLVGDCSVDFYLQKLEDGRVAARTYLYDEEPKVFCNEIDNYDLSIHSQIWIILGGAIDGGSTVLIA